MKLMVKVIFFTMSIILYVFPILIIFDSSVPFEKSILYSISYMVTYFVFILPLLDILINRCLLNLINKEKQHGN